MKNVVMKLKKIFLSLLMFCTDGPLTLGPFTLRILLRAIIAGRGKIGFRLRKDLMAQRHERIRKVRISFFDPAYIKYP